jgi:hypothetical protein
LDISERYMEESDIWEETQATLELLSRLIRLAREYGVHIRETRSLKAPADWPTLPPIGFSLHSLDIHELRVQHSELRKILGELPDIGGRMDGALPTIRIVTDVSPILRGFIEHIRPVPLIEEPTPPTMAFLSIAGFPDRRLDRDHHDVGWHYHYCDRKGRRSDTLLAFDTHQADQYDENKRLIPRALNFPLFWERHSETNARFEGHADEWGKGKRSSIFEAAHGDFVKRNPEDFRRPKDEAQPVWPINAVLSQRPTSTPSADAQPARKRKRRH